MVLQWTETQVDADITLESCPLPKGINSMKGTFYFMHIILSFLKFISCMKENDSLNIFRDR